MCAANEISHSFEEEGTPAPSAFPTEHRPWSRTGSAIALEEGTGRYNR